MASYEQLNRRFLREFPREERHPLGLRLRRSLSWLERSLHEKNDADAQFIFCWIAFNALYGQHTPSHDESSELAKQKRFFGRIANLDTTNKIHYALWEDCRDLVQSLLDNEFIYRSFWDYEMSQGELKKDWLEEFEKAKVTIQRAYRHNRTVVVLQILFGRLYILRNQILHGSSTWKSSVNRSQVVTGAKLLSFILPLILEVMMSGRDENWGTPEYPVIR